MYKLSTIAVFLTLFLFSCVNAPERPEPILDPNAVPTPVSTTSTTPPAPTAEPAQNAEGVWHYTCPTGCAGGAGSAVACATCGTTLTHNQLYHNNNPAPTPATNGLTATPAAAGGGNPISLGGNSAINPLGGAATTAVTPPPAAPKAPEPPQNAAGVWHYTCSNGCAGGAGSAVACAGCGNTLAHNQAYHN